MQNHLSLIMIRQKVYYVIQEFVQKERYVKSAILDSNVPGISWWVCLVSKQGGESKDIQSLEWFVVFCFMFR